jgi:hypothetical protein
MSRPPIRREARPPRPGESEGTHRNLGNAQMKSLCALQLALAVALSSGSTATQILQSLEDRIVGKPSTDQVAAARAEVGNAAQAALSPRVYVYQTTETGLGAELTVAGP